MDLAVIGAGAAAVALLDALCQQECAPDRILVFEPSPHLWRGGPYQPDLDEVRLNLPPGAMSVRSGEPGHFADWLRDGPFGGGRYQDVLLGQSMAPRALYGDYLQETAEAALAMLRMRGRKVEIIRTQVTGLSRGERLTLHCAAGDDRVVDRTVLCVGAGRSHDLYGLSGAPGFAVDPYPLAETLGQVDPAADVAVIGSGLTAVDVVAALKGYGHRGRISLLSRQGILPAVQQRGFRYEAVHATRDRVRELAEEHGSLTLNAVLPLFRAELAEFGEELEPLLADVTGVTTEPPVDRLRRQLGEVDSEQRARRLLLLLVRSLGSLVMSHLSERERRWVQDIHFRTVVSLCAPMIPANAAILLELCDTGQLDIVAGLERIEADGRADGGFTIHAGGKTRTADALINAVNPPPHDVSETSVSLLSSLIEGGAAEPAPGSGGINTEPGTGRVLVAGQPQHGLFALGDLAGANLFLTSSVPGLVTQVPGMLAALLA